MDKSVELKKETKPMSMRKMIAIILMVFITIPLMIIGIIYGTNDHFRYMANGYLSQLSGPVGNYFASFPTKEEKEEQKKRVAKYLIDLDIQSAADKLVIIENQDKNLYSDLIKMCTQINIEKAKNIVEYKREQMMKKDPLMSMVDQIKKEKIEEYKVQSKYYESLSTEEALHKIQNDIESEIIAYPTIAKIVEQMKEDKAVQILRYLDDINQSKLLSNMASKLKQQTIKEKLGQIKDHEKKMIKIAKIYEEEESDKLLKNIGDDKTYPIKDLAIIYENMNGIKGAEILACVPDKELLDQLLQQIKTDEILSKGKDTFTTDFIKAITVYRNYNQEIEDLIKVYEKMDNKQLAQVLSKLYKSKSTPKKYAFNNGEQIIITDQKLAIDVLRRLKEKTVAQLLETLDTTLASEISKKLTLP